MDNWRLDHVTRHTTQGHRGIFLTILMLLASCGDDAPPPLETPPTWCLGDTYQVQNLLRFQIRGQCNENAGPLVLNYEIASDDGAVAVVANIDMTCPRVSATGIVVLPTLRKHEMHAALISQEDGSMLECSYSSSPPPGIPGNP